MAKKTTTRAIRKTLVKAMEEAAAGNLSAEDGRNIIGLANQVSASMSVEVRVMSMKSKIGHQTQKFGDLEVG